MDCPPGPPTTIPTRRPPGYEIYDGPSKPGCGPPVPPHYRSHSNMILTAQHDFPSISRPRTNSPLRPRTAPAGESSISVRHWHTAINCGATGNSSRPRKTVTSICRDPAINMFSVAVGTRNSWAAEFVVWTERMHRSSREGGIARYLSTSVNVEGGRQRVGIATSRAGAISSLVSREWD